MIPANGWASTGYNPRTTGSQILPALMDYEDRREACAYFLAQVSLTLADARVISMISRDSAFVSCFVQRGTMYQFLSVELSFCTCAPTSGALMQDFSAQYFRCRPSEFLPVLQPATTRTVILARAANVPHFNIHFLPFSLSQASRFTQLTHTRFSRVRAG